MSNMCIFGESPRIYYNLDIEFSKLFCRIFVHRLIIIDRLLELRTANVQDDMHVWFSNPFVQFELTHVNIDFITN